MQSDPVTIDDGLCPLCARPNGCSIVARSNGPEGEVAACWCEALVIPEGVLERVPEAAKGRACLCRSCAMAEDERSSAAGD